MEHRDELLVVDAASDLWQLEHSESIVHALLDVDDPAAPDSCAPPSAACLAEQAAMVNTQASAVNINSNFMRRSLFIFIPSLILENEILNKVD
ncbi:MAG: hypothetical protein AB2L09_12460 [Coriobacteriia bacterium]